MSTIPSATALIRPLPAMELGDEAPTALYRLFDGVGLLLYVGISDNIKKRFAQHAADKPWWPEVARKTVEWHPTRPEAAAAESAAIKAERPVYNIAGALPPPLAEPATPTVDRAELAALLELSGAALRLAVAALAWDCSPQVAAAHLGVPDRTLRRAKRSLARAAG